MSMSKRSALLALLVAVALTLAFLAMVLLVSAEDAVEATLTVETINYNTTGAESSTTVVSTESGSYQQLIDKLAELSPTVNTRYTLRLTADATATSAAAITANEYTEIRIELDGHKLTSGITGAAITLSGEGAVLRINGGYNAVGERGELLSTSEEGCFLKIASGSSAFADVKNLSATYLGDALVSAEGGEVTLRESDVTYMGEGSAAVIEAKGSAANMKYVDVSGTDSLSVLKLSGAEGYIEGGYIFAGCAVESDEAASDVLLASVDMEVVNAFNVGSSETVTYVLGGKVHVSAAIAAGAADANNLYFYYGGGTMIVEGGDPTVYGIQASCAFATEDDAYVMSYSGSGVAMSTVATVGSAPIVKTHTSYGKSMGTDEGVTGHVSKTVEKSTVAISTLLADASVSSNHNFSGNEHVSVIVDLNGHKLTWSATSSKTFNYTGGVHYTYDGDDKDGKRGAVVSNSQNMMFFYPRQNSTTGVINEQLVTNITNIDFTVTNMGIASSNPFINFNSGAAFMDNVKLTYTGEKIAADATGTYVYLIGIDHSAGPGVDAIFNNVEVVSTYTGTVEVYPLALSAEARVWASNTKISGAYAVASGGTATELTLIDSTVSSTDLSFAGGSVYLRDSDVTIPTGVLSTSSGTVYVSTTADCKTTISTGENSLSGNYVTEEGYAMVPTADNIYKLTSGVEAPEPITVPAIFANGMVFQRGKTINVFGYCDDTEAELKITLGSREGVASVDDEGKWYVELDSINEPTWDLTLTIEQTNSMLENKISFTNVAVGEVWVMSGQSNAQLMVGYLEDVEELAVLADTLGNIRSYRASPGYSLTPSKYGSATWDADVTSKDVRSTSSSTGISAVGYAAVAKLAAELGPDVPIALVHVARGASKIKTWLDYESLAAISPSETAKYDECLANGELPASAHTKIGTILYNQQIAPLEGFEVAGVMWYQGCGDVSGEALGVEGKSYTEYFTALEKVYRRVFGNDDELPFYVMELAPYTQDNSTGVSQLSEFKAEQFQFCKDLDNTYLVSNMTDGGVWGDTIFSQGYIHPARKSTIGSRTADMILVNEYGVDLGEAYTHPTPVSVSASGSAVTVTFDTEIKLLFGDAPVGFELYDGSAWKDATATVDGKNIILTASGVSAPTMVRYGYSPIVAELKDGTMLEFLSKNVVSDSTAKTLTLTVNGVTYVVDSLNDYIRSIDYGNVTNASGIPLPVFKMPCE